MKMDVEVSADSLADVCLLSKRAEEYGFDCLWVNETKHDPFVQLALAVAETRSINVGTSIALAFTRSPTTLAYAAWDLQRLSSGRLILGLGSQVKGHIERRFGMKWEPAVPKMRDVVLAIRSVWESWQTGRPLDYRGTHFKLDLMTPFFSPGPIESPRIPIYIAGVNRLMCRLSGELTDGLHVHPLHTVRYLREVVHPALARGLEKGKRKKKDVSVAASVFAAVGDTQEEIRSVREAYRGQIAFYASTRTYRGLMERQGWGDVSDRLHGLSVLGEWGKMAGEVTDDMLDEFVVEGLWDEIGQELKSRYDGLVDRVRLYLPFDGAERWRAALTGFRA
ncbi:MAG: TIGR03617 family F420-dependent LLM class oxidoreductase [Nitrososphaerales archaeon]|jgi:probable F420-dependent oxidoreductase